MSDLVGRQLELALTVPPTLPIEGIDVYGTITDGTDVQTFRDVVPSVPDLQAPTTAPVLSVAVPATAGTATQLVLDVVFRGPRGLRAVVRLTID